MFITEWDKFRPDETEEEAEEKEKPKKSEKTEKVENVTEKVEKPKKKKPLPKKTYPHHKYEFANIGPHKLEHLENCMHMSKDSLDSTGPISLSYFTRSEAPTSQLPN